MRKSYKGLINDAIARKDVTVGESGTRDRCGEIWGGGVGVKRSEHETHSEVISMFIRPRRRGGSKSVSQGCFSVVSGCCNDDRFLENLIFSHALYFSRIRPRLAKRHVQIKSVQTASLSARQFIWISAGLTSCSENNPVNNASSRTRLMCCDAR